MKLIVILRKHSGEQEFVYEDWEWQIPEVGSCIKYFENDYDVNRVEWDLILKQVTIHCD